MGAWEDRIMKTLREDLEEGIPLKFFNTIIPPWLKLRAGKIRRRGRAKPVCRRGSAVTAPVARGPPSSWVRFIFLIFTLLSFIWLVNCRGTRSGKRVIPQGAVEGKVVLVEGFSNSITSPIKEVSSALFMESSSEGKVCLISKGKGIYETCDAEGAIDVDGNYSVKAPEGDYNECFDVNNDGYYDECDSSKIKAFQTTCEGKKEIIVKKPRPYNCFIGLDKQNYCPGDIMNISVNCAGNGYPSELTGAFVNEKNKKVYDIIQLNANDDTAYPLPITWPPTNSREGADWKIYLYSDVEEDKDNFNIIEGMVCSAPSPDSINLEVILENGKEYINYTNDILLTLFTNNTANEMDYCIGKDQCSLSGNWQGFKNNLLINLDNVSGKYIACAKVKNEKAESNLACDDIILDLNAPIVNINETSQVNSQIDDNIANDIYLDACIAEDNELDEVDIKLYDNNNNLVTETKGLFVEDLSCAQGGNGNGYRIENYFTGLNDGIYNIIIKARDKAKNEGINAVQIKVDLTAPNINFEVLDHLLATYWIYPKQRAPPQYNEEEKLNLDGSEFRYANKFTQGILSCDSGGNCYDGKLDIKINASDDSGLSKILVDWGDGNIEEYPGNITKASHPYAVNSMQETGDYLIKVKACDIYNNCSDWSQAKKVKIAITQEDADRAFWGVIKKNIERLVNAVFYGYNCDAAVEAGEGNRCAVTDDSWRRVNMIHLGISFVSDFFQGAQEVGHVYVIPEKHDHVGDENYNYPLSYCRTNVPYESGLANCEIHTARDVWFRARGPPHVIPIVPTDYWTFTSTNCNLPEDIYEKLWCAYHYEDERGDF